MAQKYRVSGTLQHGVVESDEAGKPVTVTRVYRDGDEFETDDRNLEAELRAVRTILLPEEYAAEQAASGNPAAQRELAAQRQSLEDEVARLKAELAAARGEQSGAQSQESASGEGEPPKSDGE